MIGRELPRATVVALRGNCGAHRGERSGRTRTSLSAVVGLRSPDDNRNTAIAAFEGAFARRLAVPRALAVTSGSAAIHRALSALDLDAGAEVITTPITDVAAVAPVLDHRAVPIFADVDPMRLTITPESVAARISPRTGAIIATHLFGNPCDVHGIKRVADAHGIPVIEDCREAMLATQGDDLVGTIGHFGCFSLHVGKRRSRDAGGVVVAAQAAANYRIRLFRDAATPAGESDGEPGADQRMRERQAVVAQVQLANLDTAVIRRQRRAADLTMQLIGVPGVSAPRALHDCAHVFSKYSLIIDPGIIRGGARAFCAAVQSAGVSCEPGNIRTPFIQYRTGAARSGGIVCDLEEYPGARWGLDRTVVLPWSERYRDEDVDLIASTVRGAVFRLAVRQRRTT